MNEVIVKEDIKIENLIYEVRGKQVMLASDVAKLYYVETKVINQVIKRNSNRFPKEFCFQLTKEEFSNLRSQFVTSSLKDSKNNNYGGVRYLPYVLTEQGIMMLSGLLKSDIAVEVNIRIINAFVAMRKYIGNNLLEQKHVNNMVFELDERVTLLETSYSKFDEKRKVNEIYFNGQIYECAQIRDNNLAGESPA